MKVQKRKRVDVVMLGCLLAELTGVPANVDAYIMLGLPDARHVHSLAAFYNVKKCFLGCQIHQFIYYLSEAADIL